MESNNEKQINEELINFLSAIEAEKLLPLCKILRIDQDVIDSAKKSDVNNSRHLAETIFAAMRWRASKLMNLEPSYRGILEMAAENLEIPVVGTIDILEKEISQKAFKLIMDKLTPEDKKSLENELEAKYQQIEKQITGHSGKRLAAGTTIAALSSAQLAGFGLYLTATTALSAISSTIGIPLTFTAYTTLTGALGVITGPIGIVLGGLFGIWALIQPNFKVLVPSILYITALKEEKKLLAEKAQREKHRKRVMLIIIISSAVLIASMIAWALLSGAF